MQLDRTRLIKLMGLATSANGHEALGALRKASELVKAAGETWESVLAVPEKTFRFSIHQAPPVHQQEPWVAPHLRDKVILDLMFTTIYAQPRTGNEEFWRSIDAIHHMFTEHGAVTQRQFVLLRDCYNRLTAQKVPQ